MQILKGKLAFKPKISRARPKALEWSNLGLKFKRSLGDMNLILNLILARLTNNEPNSSLVTNLGIELWTWQARVNLSWIHPYLQTISHIYDVKLLPYSMLDIKENYIFALVMFSSLSDVRTLRLPKLVEDFLDFQPAQIFKPIVNEKVDQLILDPKLLSRCWGTCFILVDFFLMYFSLI